MWGIEVKMMIPICVGHNSDWASRVGKGEHASSMGCTHDHLLYVSDSPADGLFPFSIGQAGGGEDWRHSIVEGTNAGGNGWNHNFTFYAFKTQVPGTLPYAVGHASSSYGWKYRLSENLTFAGDNGWTHAFVFYAFPVNPDNMLPVSVGSNSRHWTARVVQGVSAKNHQFQHVFTFKALQNPHADAVCFSVGGAGSGEHERHSLVRGGNASSNGWNHQMAFYAFEQQKPGTIPIAVGHAQYSAGWKFRISENCTFAGDNGWTHDFVFYAYPADTSLLMPVSVGFESTHWCARVKMGELLQEFYFQHAFTFYGFRSPYPGTIPISFGEAGADHNHTLRTRVDNGPHAGGNGWNHVFTVYAFPNRKPGTVPIAVGHADFALGCWKYRVEQNCENAGTQGWCHDFVFYAYPHPQ